MQVCNTEVQNLLEADDFIVLVHEYRILWLVILNLKQFSSWDMALINVFKRGKDKEKINKCNIHETVIKELKIKCNC